MTSSDHILTKITISTNPILIPSKPTYNYQRTNWDQFKDHMNTLELPNINTHELNNEWIKINNHIIEGANRYIPIKHFKIIHAFPYSNRTKVLIKIYNDRNNKYKDTMDNNKAEILNKIKNHIESSIFYDTSIYWQKKIENMEEYKALNDSKNLFKIAKNLMGKTNYNKGTYIIKNNTEIHDPQNQANAFAETWQNIMTENTPRNTIQVQNNINSINTWLINNNFQPHNTI